MKKILQKSFFTALCLLILQTCAFAQVTIGSGTSTQLYPFNYYYGYGRDATIYTAAEMNTVSTGGTVTTISWYTGLTSGWVSGPTVIYLKVVGSATAVTDDTWANTITGATTVYTGTPVWANGWNSIDITDFPMAANQNLEVLIESNYGGSGVAPSSGNAYRYSTGATGSHAYWAKDTNAPTAIASSDGGINTNRPNVILGGLVIPALPDCPTLNTPANGAAGIALNAPLTWTAATTGGTPTSYKVYLGTVNPPTTLISTVSAPAVTYTPSGQAFSTTYYWYVVPGNATGDAVGCNSTVNSYTTAAPPPPPSNNDCSGAIPLTVAPGNICASSVAGTTLSATASVETAPGCSAAGVNDDVWYSFVATAATNYVSITGATNTTAAAVYSGTCGSLTQVVSACSSGGLTTAAGLTPGNTYLVRVYSTSSSAATTSNFNICIFSAPANDNCAGAVAVPVNSGITCTAVVSGSLIGATASPGPASICGTYDDDVWYSFTATQSAHIITLQNLAGSVTDLTFQVLASCGASSAIVCSDPQSATITGLTPGATYYLRVASYTTGAQTSTFDVCITTPANMAYVSSTSSQPVVTSVSTGSVDQQILRADVVVSGLNSPLTLTDLTFNTTGTTLPADIASAKVYYTGTSTTFGTTTPFGTAVLNPNGTFTVTGSQVLAGAATGNTTNSFFLAYDISCTAAISNVVDAEITSMTIAATPQTPTVTAPVGTRAISSLYVPARTDGNGTTAIIGGTINSTMVSANITGSASCPANITNVTGTASGTFVAGDVVSAKCYYTTSSTFAIGSAVQFGSTIASPVTGASLVFTGSQALASGSGNYFWIVYDISCAAVAANTVNATINSLSVGATPYTISIGTISANAITALYAPARTDGNSTTAIPAGSINNTMVSANISGSASCPANVTIVTGSASGTFATGEVVAARCYYTTSSTFAIASATQFGTTINNPANTDALIFTGAQALANGTGNYFWIVYDISCGATAANTLNATITSVSVGGTPFPISTGTISANAISAASAVATTQITGGVVSGASNVQILSTSFTASPCVTSITQLNYTNSSTNAADIVTARVFYTTTSTFSSAVQFGSDVINPGASFSVSGTLAAPATGTMYFWLVYDISCSAPATAGNAADATLAGIITNSGTSVGTTPNPTGSRTITAATTGDNIQSAPVAVFGLAGGNPYNITNKGLQTGEPSPLINTQPNSTNGAGASNYSWGSAAGSTQWYKLVVPSAGYGSSGNLLIRATTAAAPNDAQVALWKFPNMVSGGCGTPANFTGGVLLAANDDAIVNGTGYTVSTLNSVIRVRLTPGSTYYIQIDGYNATLPIGDIIVEDLADAAGKNVPNNGFGDIHNPAASEILSASYEVIGDDGWTYYYNNNGTSTNIADDKVILGLNWSSSSTYLWNGSNGTATNDMMNHIRRDATSSSGPSATAPGSATGTDAFIVWSGRQAASAASADLKPTAPYVQAAASHWWMMNKFWNVFPNVQPTTAVGVRFFYSDADYTALNSAITAGGGTALTSHSNMEFLKFTKSATTHYTNAEVDPASGHSAILKPTVTKLAWTNTDAVQTGINQAQFTVNTFSGGGGGATGQADLVLPISLEYFTGRKQASGNVLDWKVSSTSTSVLTLERSTDKVSFKAINVQTATVDRMLAPFTYTDAAPAAGINYYRLKITNADGESKYSNVVALINKEKGFELISVAPNPVQHSTVLSLSSVKSGKMELSVSDATGKVVMKQSINVIAGNNPVTLNFAALAAGTYQITAVNADGDSKSTRFVKF